jgi:hypothetical protein
MNARPERIDGRSNNAKHLGGGARASRAGKAKNKTKCDGCNQTLTHNRTVSLNVFKFCFGCHAKLWTTSEFRAKFKTLWG